MKVLVVAHESVFLGGANRALFEILKYWNENLDVEFDVLVPEAKGDFVEKLKSISINTYCEKYYKVFSEKRKDYKNFLRNCNILYKYIYNVIKSKKIVRKIKNNNYDIVFSNTRMTSIGIDIAKRLNIPHVIHIREIGNQSTIWGPSSLKRIYKNSREIIVITEALKKEIIKKIPSDKITVSYDGVGYYSDSFKKIDNKKTLNFILTGRIAKAKGQDEAIKAMKKVKDDGYKNFVLNIVGSTASKSFYEMQYKNYLEQLIEKYDLTKNVIFWGEQKNMKEFRNNMDVELMCSECETFGWVTVEGMRSGLLVIGSNTGGTLEIIDDMKNGILYEQGNPQDLAQKIEYIFNEENNKLNAIKENGYNFANKNFSIKNNAMEIYNILKNTIRGRI